MNCAAESLRSLCSYVCFVHCAILSSYHGFNFLCTVSYPKIMVKSDDEEILMEEVYAGHSAQHELRFKP
ncbi:hypothetical protein FRX31_033999 [Thalictrum thalictroides]|uniref:Uncharacterized protein n=1 Tax=Thalictrum thalictroides TaxID=46969 RepID=A0A7J6UUY6_THATH|nr:hypothetical protein FRX31_033999 [Thalictrum thalictroides]